MAMVQSNPEQAKNLIEALDKYQIFLYPAGIRNLF